MPVYVTLSSSQRNKQERLTEPVEGTRNLVEGRGGLGHSVRNEETPVLGRDSSQSLC
jgi:hypothetical protein